MCLDIFNLRLLTNYRYGDIFAVMNYDDLKRKWGTQVAIAKKLGVRQPTVSGWKRSGEVPVLYQALAHVMTNCELPVDPAKLQNK